MFIDEVKVHALKCWDWSFEAVLNGSKRFEWRQDDRGFKENDIVILIEQKKATHDLHDEVHQTGRTWSGRITYILRGRLGVPDGYVVMGIKPVDQIEGQDLEMEVEELRSKCRQLSGALDEISLRARHLQNSIDNALVMKFEASS